jgi:hypothetical protein
VCVSIKTKCIFCLHSFRLLEAMKPNKKLQYWENFIIFNSSRYHRKKISECKVKTMCHFCNELTISVGLIRAGRNIRENNFLLRIFDPQFRVFCQLSFISIRDKRNIDILNDVVNV